jgi:hypothetical protein
MTIVDPLTPVLTWRSLRSCRDVTSWLEAAAAVPVHTALMQLECVPGEEAVVAAVTFVGVRRVLLAERRGDLTGLLDLRPALSACVENRDGLADGCLQLIAEEAAGGSVVELARGLHESHGLSAVLALVAVAKDLGARLVGSLERYPTYGDLYRAETEWMSRYAARLV